MADYNGFLVEQELIGNIVEGVQPNMILLKNILGYADITNKTYIGKFNSGLCGIYNTPSFGGFLDSGETVEKIIYRTVGSPRRRPLESAWTHSKDMEAFIIDEVDGDVDG